MLNLNYLNDLIPNLNDLMSNVNNLIWNRNLIKTLLVTMASSSMLHTNKVMIMSCRCAMMMLINQKKQILIFVMRMPVTSLMIPLMEVAILKYTDEMLLNSTTDSMMIMLYESRA